MVKKRWLKHLLAGGLCLLMAIPAFAQEKYWTRVSDYSDLLTRAIDSVSNLCKQSPTYGSYATGEHTFPPTLPMVGLSVKCFMEHPNPSSVSFGMTVFCPKGTFHTTVEAVVGHAVDEGCWSQMTCEQAAEQGFQRPEECCTPQPTPANGNLCPILPPENDLTGRVACNQAGAKQVCVWVDTRLDPQAYAIVRNALFEHETFHRDDPNLFCLDSGYIGGAWIPLYLSEVNATVEELKYLEDNIKECCMQSCLDDVKVAYGFAKRDCLKFANKYYRLTNIDISDRCNRSISE